MPVNKALQVQVEGAREIRATLKDLGEVQLLKQIGKHNKDLGEKVIQRAQSFARSKQEEKAAAHLKSSSSQSAVQVRLSSMVSTSKTGMRPIGIGAEFGAYHDRRHLTKNTGGRRTIVRKGEDINKVIKRVEDQTRAGYDTVAKRTRKMKSWSSVGVKVTGVSRLGWNYFKPWRGNKDNTGYFLWPAIRSMRGKIVQEYADEVERIFRGRTSSATHQLPAP